MSGYNRYLVAIRFTPSSSVHTQSSGPCPGCSGCRDCKKKELPVYPFSDTTNPGTSDNDLSEPMNVQSQETRTTDTNEEEYKKGEKCFYKTRDGLFEEGIIVSVDKSETPCSYEVKILPHIKNTTADNLHKELPSYYKSEDLKEYPVNEIEEKGITALNDGPWHQSQEQVNNQSQKLFPMIPKSNVYRDAVRSEGAGHSHGAPRLKFGDVRRSQGRKKNSSSSGRTLKHTQNNTDVVEPEYPEADYSCMSFKNLY